MIEIDESLLVRLAGARAFGQGLHCFEENCVHDVVTMDMTTNAIVQEGGQHTVCLRHTHRIIEGDCDCDVSDGIDFCQHCVAVALHLQEQQKPARSFDKRSALRQIRRHLLTLSYDELLDEFLKTIKQDRALRDDLLQKTRLSSAALSYSELKKMIDAVGAEDYLYESREVRSYFQGLESMLARLAEFADKLDPLVLLRGVERAIRQFNGDLKLIDDAGEYLDLSMEMLIDLYRVVLSRLTWTPSELASYLVDRGVAESWHPFGSFADLYQEDLGNAFHEAALAEIESRCIALKKNAAAGIEQEQTRCQLAQLKEDLNTVYDL